MTSELQTDALPQHNYLKKILRLCQEGKLARAQVTLIRVAHDDWCGIHRGHNCDCNPFVYLNGKRLE